MALTPGSTVLVTGGCGFIGTNLGRALSERGCRLVAFDNLSSGSQADAARSGYADVVVGDIRDAEAIAKAAQDADYVVHLAAQTGVIPSIQDPRSDVETNVGGTLNTLLAARDAGVDGFVFASSNAPLGSVQPPSREDLPARPLSPYGASKLAGEGLVSAFAGSYGLRTATLRFSNVYGPFSYHKGSVVALYFKCLAEQTPLVVYGDGTQTRDFVYVEDLCLGIAAALEGDVAGETFHLGTGTETTINDLVALLQKLYDDRDIVVEYRPARDGEIHRNFSDITKARTVLGYDPHTALVDGLAATRAWFEGGGV